MRSVVVLMFLLMGCGASGGGPVVTDIVAVLNGDPDVRSDFVRKFPENRSVVSDMIDALAMIGGSEWVVVDNRSTSTATRMTIQSPGSRRYDIAYRFGGDAASMFVTMPRSIDDAEVDETKIGYSIAHLSESGCEQLVGKNSREQLRIQWFGRSDAMCATWTRLLADPRWAELVAPLPAAPEFELQGWHSLAHKAGYAPGNRSFSGVAELECGAIVSYSGAVVFGDNSLDIDSAFFLANILTGESLTVEEALCG